MDESTFKTKLLHAEIMLEVDTRPDYWRGYIRGLRRAYQGERFAIRDLMRHTVFEYIEVDYNRTRQHSANGYLSPESFAAQRLA